MKDKKSKIVILLGVVYLFICMFLILKPATTITTSDWIVEENGNIKTQQMVFHPGIYHISLIYQTENDLTDSCMVSATDVGYHGLLCNEIVLQAGQTEVDFPIWLFQRTNTLQVQINHNGEGNLVVTQIQISNNREGAKLALFWGIIFFILILSYMKCLQKRTWKARSIEDRQIICGLLAIIVISSIPLMMDYLTVGADLTYHLQRIEALKAGLLAGQFPVRISPYWFGGYGYASSIMYGEVFLIIPTIFRMLGMTVMHSYKLFVFIINIVTCLISYGCFKKIFQDRRIGLLGSMLYTLAIYRFDNVYIRVAVGEYLAMAFFPLICYGLYAIYQIDIDNNNSIGRKRIITVLPLILGLSGVIQSHIISCEIVGIFIALFCLINWKRTISKGIFGNLCLTVITTFLVNAWFLIPFADYMMTQDFQVKHFDATFIQQFGLYPAHLFLLFMDAGTTADFGGSGMIGTNPISIGIAGWIGIITFLYFCYWDKKRKESILSNALLEKKVGFYNTILAFIAMFMSLSIFPWDRLQKMNAVFSLMISCIQFPTRIIGVATVFTVIVCCAATQIGKKTGTEENQNRVMPVLIGAMIVVSLTTFLYTAADTLYTKTFYRLYNAENMGSTEVGKGEYTPFGTERALLVQNQATSSDNIEIITCERKNLQVTVQCKNTSQNQEGYLDVPLLMYKGYLAVVQETGEQLEVSYGTNNVVQVKVPAGFQGTVITRFCSPWYWRAAELVSLCLIIGIGFYLIVIKRKEQKAIEN